MLLRLPFSRRSSWQGVALALLLLAGLWSSLHHAFWLWPADPDLATPWLVWHQVAQDGPRILLRWRFAQDNWLLSLLLPDLVLFGLLGGSPLVVLVQGWAVFVAVSGLLFLLLRRISGPRAAVLAATLPLLAGPSALGRIGFLTYAVSHEVSVLWGLAALACATAHLRRGGPLRLAAMGACQVVGALSDPWLTASLVLPTLLAATLAIPLPGMPRLRLLAVAAVTGLGMGLVGNRLLVLHALPGPVFAPGPPALWAVHLGWVLRYVAALFGIAPLPLPDPLWLPSGPMAALEALPPALAMLWAILRVWRARARLLPEQALLSLVALLSAAATVSAFVLSDIAPEPGSGRYLGNLAVVLPLLLGCAWTAGSRPGRLPHAVLAAWNGLFVLAGAVAAPAQLLGLPAATALPWQLALARFLEAHGLHDGYGGFWGSQASAITWLTNGRVALRAVEASPSPGSRRDGPQHVEPRLAQSFPSWFPAAGQAAPAAPGARSFFVAQPSDELCPTLPDCLALATSSFGPPDETLRLGPLPILVWNRPVLARPVAATVAAAPPLGPGSTRTFGAGGDGGALLWQGWSPPEPSVTWTQASRAVLLLHLPAGWSGDAVLEAEASAYPRRDATAQPVTIIAHDATNPDDPGTPLATWTVTPFRRARYQAVLPWSVARSRLLWLQLDIPGADLPSRANGGFDPRALGLSLRSLTLRPLDEPIP